MFAGELRAYLTDHDADGGYPGDTVDGLDPRLPSGRNEEAHYPSLLTGG
jgi:hypothetical protein